MGVLGRQDPAALHGPLGEMVSWGWGYTPAHDEAEEGEDALVWEPQPEKGGGGEGGRAWVPEHEGAGEGEAQNHARDLGVAGEGQQRRQPLWGQEARRADHALVARPPSLRPPPQTDPAQRRNRRKEDSAREIL